MNNISLEESQISEQKFRLDIELKEIVPQFFDEIQFSSLRRTEVLLAISEMQLNIGYADDILNLHFKELSQLSQQDLISEVVTRVIAKEQEMATEEFIQSEQLGINLQISQFWSDTSKDKQGPKLYVSKKQFEWKQQQPLFECGICYDSKTMQFLETSPCKSHQFCVECVNSYISNAIRSSQIIKICCPQEGCIVEFDEPYIATVLSEEKFLNYVKHKRIFTISQNPNVRWCPKIDCTSYVVGPPSNNQRILTCECGQVICYDCGHSDHTGQSCQQAVDYTYQEALKKYIIHSCPKCLAPIQKAQGCNHITCVKCKYNFCWLCRRTYQNGHYGSSLFACHGKQFSDDKPAKHPYLLLGIFVFFRLIFMLLRLIYKIIFFILAHLIALIMILITLPRDPILNFFPAAQVIVFLKNPRWQYFMVKGLLILVGIILIPITTTLMIFPGSCVMIYRRFFK